MQNSEEVVGVTLAKGMSNKHLSATHLSSLLSHLWLSHSNNLQELFFYIVPIKNILQDICLCLFSWINACIFRCHFWIYSESIETKMAIKKLKIIFHKQKNSTIFLLPQIFFLDQKKIFKINLKFFKNIYNRVLDKKCIHCRHLVLGSLLV